MYFYCWGTEVILTWKNLNGINLWFIGLDFTNNKKEEYGPGVQGKEHPAHLDPSAPIPSAAAAAPSPAGAAMGATGTAAFPSATSITSAGAASTSSVSAPLGAGSTAPAAPEEMVSAVHAGACLGKGFPTCWYIGYFKLRTYFLMEKKLIWF